MAAFLFIMCGLFFVFGFGQIVIAETVFQQQAGSTSILISAIFFVGGAIVNAISSLRGK